MKTTHLKKILFLFLISAFQPLFSQIWNVQTSGTYDDLKACYFVDANTGWAAGENGTMIKTTDGGSNWSPLSIQASIPTFGATIRGIYFFNTQIGWACGDSARVIKTTDGGTTWSLQNSSAASNHLYNIKFIDANNGWMVGANGICRRTINGGSNWTSTLNPISTTAWGLNVIGTSDVWVCGSSRKVNHSTNGGSTWPAECNFIGAPPLPGATTFDDMEMVDADHGWIVGGQGLANSRIFKITTGTSNYCNWIPDINPISAELLSIDMINLQKGWACGRGGNIVHTSDGGATSWAAQYSGTTHNLWQIFFVNDTTGWAVGDSGTIRKYAVYNSSAPLTLTQPNGGEVWQIGTTHTITWFNNPTVTNISIELSLNGPLGPYSTLATSVNANLGFYSWNIASPQSLNAYIRIADTSNPLNADTSDALFYIQPIPQGDDYAVLMTSTSSNSPAQIVLNWNANPNALTCTLDRKLKSDVNWTFVTNIPANTNTYTDLNVNNGEAWEYRVTRTTPQLTAYGYIHAGLEYPETDFRGKILLLIDQNYASSISTEVDQFELDLIGDGYRIAKQVVDPNIGVAAIKNIIQQEYSNDTSLSSVLTIGHLPAPYSGNFAPDGHAERVGAQPADGYYGDVDFTWTDNSVITSNVGTIYTPNVIGDGKFDHSSFPSDIELQVGRIDMNDMTGFALSETGLLQQYFQKDHNFRFKVANPGYRALMNTTMDAQLPNVSAAAWRSYSAMFGNGIKELNNCNTGCTEFIDSLRTESYLWAHMAGGGSDTSMSNDVFTSSQCISNPIKTVFMQMYGSYFVEWYKGGISTLHNHLLRAPLASNGTTLASVWSGKAPYWHFHHMALGETIGYSTVTNQNNLTTYDAGNTPLQKGVHMALMGDPTLKMHIVAPISSLTINASGATVDLNWSPSPDNNIVGYNVYRADSIYGVFTKLNSAHIISTNYTDIAPLAGNSVYMVRAVKLENGTFGSYYNLSTGLIDSVFTSLGDPTLNDQSFRIYPNPTADIINFSLELENIEIYNVYGQLVRSNILNAKSISVADLANGIYFIRSGIINKKFIVKH